jgi:hypothetical protein
MSNKQTQEFSTATLESLTAEIQQRTKDGYSIKSGPDYSAGEYTVTFERERASEPEVAEVVPVQQPVAPVEAKPQHKHTRGPKPKTKKESEPAKAPVEE